jgi:nitronate monooxygenase
MALPEFLSSRLRLPAVAAPLFIISNPDLVIEQCKAGVVGSFPSLNARPIEELERWLQRITSELAAYDEAHPDAPAAPFAVNLIVHGSNNRLQEDLELCVKYKVPIVITSLGAKEFVNEAIHSYGGVVFHDIINNRFARKAIEKGADGLIAVAAGAGGHAGTISPFALVQEIREWFDGPLLLSGSIANGKAILAAQAMGADLAYIGSPLSPRRKPTPSRRTSRPSSTTTPRISCTATCSPASTATTWPRQSRPRDWIRRTFRKATRPRWTSAPAVTRMPRPGRISGVAVRVSAR